VKPVPAIHSDLARRLLECEAAPGEQPPGLPAADRACARLREDLAKLVGPAGFDALLRRALYLARTEHPLLEGIHASGDTCFKGLAGRASGQDPIAVNAALVAVFGRFLWLLSTFIGEDLAQRQVRRIWPELLLDQAGAGIEEAVQ